MTNCNDYKTGLYNINSTTQSSEEVIKGTIIVPKDKLPDDVKTECIIEGSRRENENEPEKIGSETKNGCTSQIDGIVNSFSIEADLFDTKTDIMQKYQLYNYYQDVKKTTSDTYETVCQVETTDNCCIKLDHSETEKIKADLRKEDGDIVDEVERVELNQIFQVMDASFEYNLVYCDEDGTLLFLESDGTPQYQNKKSYKFTNDIDPDSKIDYRNIGVYFTYNIAANKFVRTKTATPSYCQYTPNIQSDISSGAVDKDNYSIVGWGVADSQNHVPTRQDLSTPIDLLKYSGNKIGVVCKLNRIEKVVDMPVLTNYGSMKVVGKKRKINNSWTAISDKGKSYALINNKEYLPVIEWNPPFDKEKGLYCSKYVTDKESSYWLCFCLLRTKNGKEDDQSEFNYFSVDNGYPDISETFNGKKYGIYYLYDEMKNDEQEIGCCYFKIERDYTNYKKYTDSAGNEVFESEDDLKDVDVMWHFHTNVGWYDRGGTNNGINGTLLFLKRSSANTRPKNFDGVEIVRNYSDKNYGYSSVVKVYDINNKEIDVPESGKYYKLSIVNKVVKCNTSDNNANLIIKKNLKDETNVYPSKDGYPFGYCDFVMEAKEVNFVPSETQDTPKIRMVKNGGEIKFYCNVTIYSYVNKTVIDNVEKEVSYNLLTKYYDFDETNFTISKRIKDNIEESDKSSLLWKPYSFDTSQKYIIECNLDSYKTYKDDVKIDDCQNGFDIMKYSNVKIYYIDTE